MWGASFCPGRPKCLTILPLTIDKISLVKTFSAASPAPQIPYMNSVEIRYRSVQVCDGLLNGMRVVKQKTSQLQEHECLGITNLP